MKSCLLRFVCLAALACAGPAGAQNAAAPRDFAIAPVPFKEVQIADDFWRPRLENNRNITIPALLTRYGEHPDLRLLEAVCYELERKPDAGLKQRIDAALDAHIAAIRSQEQRWSNEGDGSFFNAGNFLEAAVAYYEATGSRKLLDVAIEIANDLDASFGPDKRHDISNHEGIKIGLLRLYRGTHDEKYLRLAKFFLDARGNPDHRAKMFGSYAQDQEPVILQTRAIGHAVRATYLYTPLTELAALTGNPAYAAASERIWDDAMSKRTFLTGGFGSYRDQENFGDDYDLPNASCWNEICAAYGGTLWNEKLFLLTQDGKYADMLEHTLYNALLAGVSLRGDMFLYQAPLKAFAGFGRQAWFGPNCCPPNVARLLPQLGALAYAHNDNSIYINLFVAGAAAIMLGSHPVVISQETKYPWDGRVKISVNPQTPAKFAVYVRIPGWVQGNGWPTGLYRDEPMAESEQGFSLVVTVGGVSYPVSGQTEKGYVKIEMEWKAGDAIELKMKMPVRQVLASENVAEDRGLVALERGPLVFCLEKTDNPGGVFNLVLPPTTDLRFVFRPDLLGGIGTIAGEALALSRGPDRVSVVKQLRPFTAIPYYAFANRDRGEMAVWLARDEGKAQLPPVPTIASTSRATSSCGNGSVSDNYPGYRPPSVQQRMYPLSQDGSGDISAIYDQAEPVNSEDGSARFLRLRPQTGSNAWVQYDFAKPEKVSSVEVYWKDDKQFCVPPQSWRVLYRDGQEWKPVNTISAGPVEKDKFNKTTFEPVTTSALRLDITLREKVYKKGSLGPPDANYLTRDTAWYEGGVIEWRINP
jgi:hypothetical protein